ncbi:DsbA family protein [Patescibacteria group bacterium]|nr:DsbA family protein [Patescibacteria group bacterium]
MNGDQEQPLTKKKRKELRRQEKLDNRDKEAKKKTMNRLIMWVFILLLLGGIVYALTLLAGSDSSSDSASQPISVDVVSATDHVKGSPEAKVVLIEYSDFQCPACGSIYPTVKQLAEEFSDTAQIVYRHYPLRQIHSNAQLAGQASEAASMQGKFWEMHDKLFENQDNWSDKGNPEDLFITYAEEIGLDTAQFGTDLKSDATKDRVNDDFRSGTAAQVSGTPTFFLNGERIDNPSGLDDFRTQLQAAIDQAGGSNSDEVTDEQVDANSEADDTNVESTEQDE